MGDDASLNSMSSSVMADTLNRWAIRPLLEFYSGDTYDELNIDLFMHAGKKPREHQDFVVEYEGKRPKVKETVAAKARVLKKQVKDVEQAQAVVDAITARYHAELEAPAADLDEKKEVLLTTKKNSEAYMTNVRDDEKKYKISKAIGRNSFRRFKTGTPDQVRKVALGDLSEHPLKFFMEEYTRDHATVFAQALENGKYRENPDCPDPEYALYRADDEPSGKFKRRIFGKLLGMVDPTEAPPVSALVAIAPPEPPVSAVPAGVPPILSIPTIRNAVAPHFHAEEPGSIEGAMALAQQMMDQGQALMAMVSRKRARADEPILDSVPEGDEGAIEEDEPEQGGKRQRIEPQL